MAQRTLAAIDAQLALKVHKARRLPKHHPDREQLHADIDLLLGERERAVASPRRPSHVLADPKAAAR